MTLTAVARGPSTSNSRRSESVDTPSRRNTELTLAQERAARASANDKREASLLLLCSPLFELSTLTPSRRDPPPPHCTPTPLSIPQTGGARSTPTSTFGREQKKSQFKRAKPVAEDQKGLYLVLQDATYTFMVKTNAGFCLDLLQTVLSLVACILYVVETYMEMEGPYPDSIVTVSLCSTENWLFRTSIKSSTQSNLMHADGMGACWDLPFRLPSPYVHLRECIAVLSLHWGYDGPFCHHSSRFIHPRCRLLLRFPSGTQDRASSKVTFVIVYCVQCLTN